jgi:hypothetical protein
MCAIAKKSQLRTFLVELNYHRLIVSKTEDRVDLVRVPCSEAKLHKILAYNRDDTGK